MNLAEIEAAWLRYIHRADLSADMATTVEMATAKVVERLMYLPDDELMTIDEMVGQMPRMFLHAGLCYLHELSEDDEGLMRETQLFAQAATDHHFLRSQGGVSPTATTPYAT